MAAWPEEWASAPEPPFECGDALLQYIRRRVHDTRVDVAELLQAEEVCGMFGVAELVAGGLVDRHGARSGGRVGLLASVEGLGSEFHGEGGVGFVYRVLRQFKQAVFGLWGCRMLGLRCKVGHAPPISTTLHGAFRCRCRMA